MNAKAWLAGSGAGMVAGSIFGLVYLGNRNSPRALDSVFSEFAFESGNRLLTGTTGFDIVEFLDYQCPGCRSGASELPDSLKREDVSSGLVVIRFPLPIHNQANAASLAMVAAKALNIDRKLHYELIAMPKLDDVSIEKQVKLLGVKPSVWTQVLRSQDSTKTVEQLRHSAWSLGVVGTPTFGVRTPRKRMYLFRSSAECLRFIANWSQTPPLPWSP